MHWAIRSSQWMLALQALRMLLAFTLGAWMARVLGPQQYGLWGTAVAWSGVAASLAELGLRQLILRLIGQRPRLTLQVAGTAFRIWTLLSLACVMLIVLINHLTGNTILLPVLLAAATPYLLSGFAIHHVIFDATQQAHISARNSILAAIISSIIRIFALLWLPTLTALTWSVSADMILVYLFAAYRGKQTTLGWLPKQWNRKLAVYMLRRGITLVMSQLGLVILLRIAVIILEKLVGSEQAGIYNAATRLSEICYFVCPMLVTIFLPKLAKHYRHDTARFHQLSLQSCQLMTLIAYGFIVGLTLFGAWAVHFLFGREYEPSVKVLRVHALACLPYFMIEWRYQLLVTMDQTRLNAILLWVGCLINVILNLILISTHGAVGAAWASFLSYFACGPLLCLLIPHLRWMAVIQLKSLFFPITILFSPLKTWNHHILPLLRPNGSAQAMDDPPQS